MKGFIAIVLATALFLGIGASMAPPATAEVKVTMVDDGFLIENADIPDLSKVIQQNNLEKNFVDLIVKIHDTIDKNEWHKISELNIDPSLAERIYVGIWSNTAFMYEEAFPSDEKKTMILNSDVQIGTSKTVDTYRLSYVITTDEKSCYYIFIEQGKKTLFIKGGTDIAKKSRDVIRRLLNTNDENIAFYDFDLIFAIEYRTKQL